MDTTNPGAGRPLLLKCGTSGSFLTPQESFTPCDDTQETSRLKSPGFKGVVDPTGRASPCPSRTTYNDVSGSGLDAISNIPSTEHHDLRRLSQKSSDWPISISGAAQCFL